MNRLTWTATILTFALASCGSPEATDGSGEAPVAAQPAAEPAAGDAMRAVAMLRKADGTAAGTATATATAADGQVAIALQVQGLPPGQHGVHVHMTGRCDAPTFQSAGGHWNPANATHGLEDPAGQHAGDMPNLTVGGDGAGTLEYQLVGGSFDGLMDADGSAFVVHASADDQRSDPSGNSGDRIACGVFERG